MNDPSQSAGPGPAPRPDGVVHAPLQGQPPGPAGGASTRKEESRAYAPALATPPTVTTAFPVEAPAGTVAVMLEALHVVVAAVIPLTLTMLVPFVAPKFDL